MTTSNQDAPTKAFWIICIIALLWNLMGIMSFIMEVFMSPEALAALPEAERALYENTPLWIHIVFAIAVFDGTLGCVLLLMKNKLAIPMFVISLVAVLAQMTHWLLLTNAMEVYGPESVIMPTLVIAIAAFLVWYSYKVKANGWMS